MLAMSFISYLSNMNLKTLKTNFSEKTAFESGLRFLTETHLCFELGFVPYVLPNPLYQNVRVDHGIIFTFS